MDDLFATHLETSRYGRDKSILYKHYDGPGFKMSNAELREIAGNVESSADVVEQALKELAYRKKKMFDYVGGQKVDTSIPMVAPKLATPYTKIQAPRPTLANPNPFQGRDWTLPLLVGVGILFVGVLWYSNRTPLEPTHVADDLEHGRHKHDGTQPTTESARPGHHSTVSWF